jgi:hypothetical protein
MVHDGLVGGRLTDWIFLGVLASWVPADAVDDAVEATGRRAQRRGGKLPPRVTAYLVMALALFADEDYEEVAARLAGTMRDWGGWEESWGEIPTSGGITQARRLMEYPCNLPLSLGMVRGRCGAGLVSKCPAARVRGRWSVVRLC